MQLREAVAENCKKKHILLNHYLGEPNFCKRRYLRVRMILLYALKRPRNKHFKKTGVITSDGFLQRLSYFVGSNSSNTYMFTKESAKLLLKISKYEMIW